MRRKRTNPNAPRKGSKIKVEPIRRLEDIRHIRRMLQDKHRDLALFTLGINTNLRASDLLKLRVYQVRDLEAGGSVEINEKKTGNLAGSPWTGFVFKPSGIFLKRRPITRGTPV